MLSGLGIARGCVCVGLGTPACRGGVWKGIACAGMVWMLGGAGQRPPPPVQVCAWCVQCVW